MSTIVSTRPRTVSRKYEVPQAAPDQIQSARVDALSQRHRRWLALGQAISLTAVGVLTLLLTLGWSPPRIISAGPASVGTTEALALAAIAPSVAPNDLDTPIIITGTGFTLELSGTIVISLPTVSLNDKPLIDVGWISSTELTATVPWGLDAGAYTVTVANPDGGSASLDGAFAVNQGIGVWTTGGPYGGSVTTLLMNPVTPTTLYATVPAGGVGLGLFRSVNGGERWEMIVADIGSQSHSADLSVHDPAVIYLHKWNEGLYRSDDGGDHWTTLPFPHPTCNSLRPYAAPGVSQTVYVATDCADSGGVLESNDRGQSWITRTEGLTDTHVTALGINPDKPQEMVAGTGSGNVFRSNDGGVTWTFLGRPDHYIGGVAINPFGAQEPWAAGADYGGHWGYLWKYVDSQWVQVLPGAGAQNEASSIVFSTEVSGTMWIGSFDGALASTDGGDTWEPLGGPPRHVNALVVDPTNPQVMYLGFNGTGIVKTTDGGASWTEINQGLAGVYPNGLAIHPDDPARVYSTAHGEGTFATNNGGGSWIGFPSDNLVPRAPAVDPFIPGRIYIAGGSDVCATEDNGSTWDCALLAPPPAYESCCSLHVIALLSVNQPGLLVMGVGLTDSDAPSFQLVGGAIYISKDHGASWSHVDVSQEIGPVGVLASHPNDSATIYAGAGGCCEERGAGIWKSEDGGTTWNPSGLLGQPITGIAVDPFSPKIVYALSQQQFYVSSDGGATWVLRATMDPEDYGMERLLVVPTMPPTLYQYGWRGVLQSVDGGMHWARAAESLGYTNVGAMAATTAQGRVILYAGTGGGTGVVVTTSARGLAATGDALRGAGVRRNTVRLLNRRLYTPLVLR